MKKIFLLFIFIISISTGNLCTAQIQDATETEYMAVMTEGKKIGYVIHTRKIESGKVTNTEYMKMTVARAGLAITVSTSESSIETIDGTPLGFELIQNISGMSTKTTGTITNGKIEVVNEGMGAVQKSAIDYPKGALMAEGLRLLELEKKLTKGNSYDAVLFSPSLLSAVKANVSVGDVKEIDLFGRPTQLTEMTVVMKLPTGEVTSVSYVDNELKPLKTLLPMMGMTFELIICDKTFALSDNDVVDFLNRLLLKSPQPLNDIRSKESAVYELTANGDKKLQFHSGDNQTVKETKNGKITITVKPVKAAAGEKFPYEGDDEELLNALKPSQYVQSDNKKVIELARHAVGDSKDSTEAITRIESFVDGYITKKDLSIGYASAAEVALSRQGDCSEHAVLTTAMCRAVGIPARVVTGIVYVDELNGKESIFGGHCWTQAHVGDKWIGLDATLAPNGFSPGHIAFSVGNGDPAEFFGIVNTLGNFTIDKIVTQDKPAQN